MRVVRPGWYRSRSRDSIGQMQLIIQTFGNVARPAPPPGAAGFQAPTRPWVMISHKAELHAFFESAVTALMDRLYGAAMRFTRDPTNAEDLVAEALAKAWKSIDKLEDRKRFDGWMMRILSNTYISQWRHQKIHDEIFEDDLRADDLDDTQSLYARLHQPFLLWWGTPEQTFVNNLLNEDIEKALDELADGYRIVVVMVEMLGFTYDEVAEALEIPVGTVRSRLNRGRRQLQNALWEHARDAGIVSSPTLGGEG